MGDNRVLFDFLADLRANNNREWFKAHRDRYDAAWRRFNECVEELIAGIAKFDPEIAHLQPSDCTYRIYRDIRFSPDKTPHKGHFGAYISRYGKKSYWGGYYVQVEPGRVMLASGVWYLPPKEMQRLRTSILDQLSEYEAIVENPAFKKLVGGIGQENYRRLPPGIPKDTPHPEYFLCKDYAVWCELKPKAFCTKDYAKKVADIFLTMKPFNDFLAENIVINMEEQETLKDIVKIF